MKLVNMQQARSQLSKLVELARRGEEIWIGKAGQPVAKLSALHIPQKPRRPGLLKGKLKIRRDYDQRPVAQSTNSPR